MGVKRFAAASCVTRGGEGARVATALRAVARRESEEWSDERRGEERSSVVETGETRIRAEQGFTRQVAREVSTGLHARVRRHTRCIECVQLCAAKRVLHSQKEIVDPPLAESSQ